MSWQTKMMINGWRLRGNRWIYNRKINGRFITMPLFMAKVWEKLNRIPVI